MAHTNSTENYNLPQFIGTDKPGWLTDVNSAYLAIDNQMKTNADGVAANAASISANKTEYDAFVESQTGQNNTFIDEISALQETDDGSVWEEPVTCNLSSSNENYTLLTAESGRASNPIINTKVFMQQTKNGRYVRFYGLFTVTPSDYSLSTPIERCTNYATTIQITPSSALHKLPSEQITYDSSILTQTHTSGVDTITLQTEVKLNMGRDNADDEIEAYTLQYAPIVMYGDYFVKVSDTHFVDLRLSDHNKFYITTAGSLVVNLTIPNFQKNYFKSGTTETYSLNSYSFLINPIILPTDTWNS